MPACQSCSHAHSQTSGPETQEGKASLRFANEILGGLFVGGFLLMYCSTTGELTLLAPLQLTSALGEPSAVSKVQMEGCQQRDSFRSASCMIHPWHEDRPGGGLTTPTPIGEPGREPKCPGLGSAGRAQVRRRPEPTTWPLL